MERLGRSPNKRILTSVVDLKGLISESAVHAGKKWRDFGVRKVFAFLDNDKAVAGRLSASKRNSACNALEVGSTRISPAIDRPLLHGPRPPGSSGSRSFSNQISVVRFSAILLHMLPMSAQCDYNANENRGHRRPL